MKAMAKWRGRVGFLMVAAAALGSRPAGAQARQGPMGFHPLPTCRLWDTRLPPGPTGGPSLLANTTRCFPVQGLCGVPAEARAAAFGLTALGATDSGTVRVFPSGGPPPSGLVLNVKRNGPGVSASGAVAVGTDGRVCVRVDMPSGSPGWVHLISDVSGYYTTR